MDGVRFWIQKARIRTVENAPIRRIRKTPEGKLLFWLTGGTYDAKINTQTKYVERRGARFSPDSVSEWVHGYSQNQFVEWAHLTSVFYLARSDTYQ